MSVLVLHPSYPQPLRSREEILAGGVAAAFSVRLTLDASVAADFAAAEQDLVSQVAAWFGLGEVIAVCRVAEGLMSRNWRVATTAGTVAVKQVAVAALARRGAGVEHGDQ